MVNYTTKLMVIESPLSKVFCISMQILAWIFGTATGVRIIEVTL